MILENIKNIKPNPNNPRIIKDEKFKKLVKSIDEFPDMLNKRPLVCFTDTDGKFVVLGGNMRLKACKELKLKEIPIILADEWTEEQKQEFLVKDNVGFGEWDWDVLTNEWDVDQLNDWGLELDINKKINKSTEGETIEVERSLQVLPKKEYVIIYADEDSLEWDELKTIMQCKLVRQGGCEIGSTSDKATSGLQRVFTVEMFKERIKQWNL